MSIDRKLVPNNKSIMHNNSETIILAGMAPHSSRLLDSLDLSHPTYYRGTWSRLMDKRFARDVYLASGTKKMY